LHRKAQLFEEARWRACSAMVATWVRGLGGPTNSCPCIDTHPWRRPGGNRPPRRWAALARLIELRYINQVIACSLIYNMNLACVEGRRLDCCDMIAATRDHDIAIISSGRLYFVLSCPLAPTDTSSMQHGRRAGSGATCALVGPHLSSGVDSKSFESGSWWASGLRTPTTWWARTQDWTCPWNLACDLPFTSFLIELAVGQDASPIPDPTPYHGSNQGSAA
jgi:hypothetical protein